MALNKNTKPGLRVVRILWENGIPFFEYGITYTTGSTNQIRVCYPSERGRLKASLTEIEAIDNEIDLIFYYQNEDSRFKEIPKRATELLNKLSKLRILRKSFDSK